MRKHKPTLIFLIETHVQFEKVKVFWQRKGYFPIHIVEARGHSGGLWALAQVGHNLDISVWEFSSQTISLEFKSGTQKWICTGTYASPNPTIRNTLWQHLCDLNQNINSPWLLLGDWNEILFPGEQKGCIFSQSRASSFERVLDICGLLDINTTGGKFTWHCTQGYHQRAKKLDRGLANLQWRMEFPEASIEVLCRMHSDHNPLLLRLGGMPQVRGPKPFRFEAAWIVHNEYQGVVQTAWEEKRGKPIDALAHVQEKSVIFNREIFGNIFKRKRIIEARMKGIQRTLERVDSLSLYHLEQSLQHEFNHILFQEEVFWFQKSREQWVKLGDKNTPYFHAQTVIRRKRNKVHGLTLPNGIWTSDEEVLQQEALTYFKNLFCTNLSLQDVDFPLNNVPRISDEERSQLLHPVSREEVLQALNTMKPYKAPGPDGFQAIFFKQYWSIVGEDIWRMVNDALVSGTIDLALTKTLIVLIPKVDNPKNFKEFRPISLCNTIYKILTKVLVHRIRPILNNLIGPFQSSFLPGRGTTDNVIVLQEIVHAMRKSKKKKGDVAYKIDLEKAYDHVSWDFLKLTLHDFGFPPILVSLIMQCVTASSLSILWNGKRLPSFCPTRGLRQGDPLSPYLFVLCMEKLSLAIQDEVTKGNWMPFKVSRNGPLLSHLLFADDLLLFTKARSSQAKLVSAVLEKFGKASGLKVNINKSRAFFSAGVPNAKAKKSTEITQIREAKSLGKYLGFPLFNGRPAKKDVEFITEKMSSRLASWKHRLLNKAGRVALASSVLTAIPSYYMQVCWLPQSVCSHIDKISRDFIWKGSQNKGVNLVNWQKVTQPKVLGGLGIRTAREANTALLGKLV